jgi:putative FmdB family regulatory protein
MPIYEYKCRECGDKFEKLVRSSVTPAESRTDLVCPVCGSPKVDRQISLCGCLSGAAGAGDRSASPRSCAPSSAG